MTPEEKKELTKHINAIGKILYKQAKPEQVETLRVRADRRQDDGESFAFRAKIEETVREQMLEHISPQIGISWCAFPCAAATNVADSRLRRLGGKAFAQKRLTPQRSEGTQPAKRR